MQSQPFGSVCGRGVTRYTLANARGTRVCVLDFGGIVQEFSVMENGIRRQLVVGFDNAQTYADNPFQVNKQIGRVAGRIRGAAFELDGTSCRVEANEGRHTLHGGSQGLGTRILDAESFDGRSLVLHTLVKESEDGFPNDLDLRITYRLDDEDRLRIDYHAVARGGTVFDPTLHLYWLLPPGLHGATLTIPQGQRAVLDGENLPTGAFDPEPLFDFSDGLELAGAVAALRAHGIKNGFDEAYRVPVGLSEPVAVLEHSGRRIKIFSDRNGLVVFTASPDDIGQHDAGVYHALATEPQTLPDSLHLPAFGNIRLPDGGRHTSSMIFQIETI